MATKDEKKQEIKQLVEKVTSILDKRTIIVTNKAFNGDNQTILSETLKKSQNNS